MTINLERLSLRIDHSFPCSVFGTTYLFGLGVATFIGAEVTISSRIILVSLTREGYETYKDGM